MPDMMVKTYQLPDSRELYQSVRDSGIVLKRAIAPEMHHVTAFAKEHFSQAWASEAAVCFSNKPVSCFIATDKGKIVGFSCCETTCRGFFGPTGVLESHRGRNIGRALLMMALEHLRDIGYAYAVIGGAGPTEFYAKSCGAVRIPGSNPGIYADMVRD